MTYDTIRQKFIYNTPYDDNEFPLVVEDEFDKNSVESISIPISTLYRLEEEQFNNLIKNVRTSGYTKVVIVNDYILISNNQVLNNAALCYLKAFLYLFKKKGFQCLISK